MGFENNTVRLLIKAKNELDLNFTKTLTIGRQGLHVNRAKMDQILLSNNISPKDDFYSSGYSEPLLFTLGAKEVDSIDASHYEEATIIHDMNKPIPDNLKNRFSAVIDGGSLEHVFNFPQAIINCMEMVALHGHFVGITPANNFFGHGFYQFSPELFFRIMDIKNGFRLTKMYLFVEGSDSEIFEVADPIEVNNRVALVNTKPTYLFIVAQKTESKTIFAEFPMQSDYENIAWKGNVPDKGKTNENNSSVIKLIKALIPEKIKTFLALNIRPTGISNQEHFKKIK